VTEPGKINEDRLFQEFVTLAEIASPSFKERELADYLCDRLQGLGLAVEEDDTGKVINGSTGNLLARLPGRKDYPPLLFVCPRGWCAGNLREGGLSLPGRYCFRR
jgi:tripeptide aminopeptidase